LEWLMPPDALAALRQVNDNLALAVLHLRPERKQISTLSPHDFSDLRNQLLNAGKCLRLLPPLSNAEGETRKELLEYRNNLEKLKQLLPDVQARLLAEKSRLAAARTHAAAVAHWAQAR
jgi:hypothetical protein